MSLAKSALLFPRCGQIISRYISAGVRPESYLVVPGSLGRQVDTVVKPIVDTNQLKDVAKLQENLDKRGIEVSAKEVIGKWEAYKNLKDEAERIEKMRKENTKKMEGLKLGENWKLDPVFNELRGAGVHLRNEAKRVQKMLEEVEVPTLIKVLSLPNSLCNDNFQTQIFGKQPRERMEVDTNVESSVSEHHPFYYFTKENAVIELKLCQKLLNSLKSTGFSVVSPPDFVRSAVVEGSGFDYDEVFTLNEPDISDPLRVVGGASLPGISTLFVRTTVRNETPLRFCALGRRYRPTVSKNLSNSSQKTCVQTLSIVKPEDLNSEVDSLINRLIEFYSSLQIHFRVTKSSSIDLKRYEMSRICIEMFSTSLEKYVEVASVSKIGDYTSRRLAMYFHPRGDGKFVNIVSGTAIDYQSFCSVGTREVEFLYLWSLDLVEITEFNKSFLPFLCFEKMTWPDYELSL